jgi:hypothetical protein
MLHIVQQLVIEATRGGATTGGLESMEDIWTKSDKLCLKMFEKDTTITFAKKIIKANDLSTYHPDCHEAS